MGPQVALLVAALAGCLLPAGGCVMCDQRVVAALDALEKEYLPTHLARERQGQVMETIRQTVRNFWDLPYLEDAFMGVIDEATMETSVLGFLRSMTLITNSDIADDTFVKEFSWMLTLEKAAFQRNVARFQREDFCPNKCEDPGPQWSFCTADFLDSGSYCMWAPRRARLDPSSRSLFYRDKCNLDPAPSGIMLQPLIWCSNCKKQLHVCRKSTDCGVRQINVHEKEDLVLDCELNWHKLSQGLTYYSFYRVWGSNSETLVYKGKQPTLTKPLVEPEDAGDYRCELGTVRSLPATVIHFKVTVLPQRIIEETPTSNFETEEQLSPTLQPSEYPKPEKVLRSLLVGLLIWGFVVLIISFVTAVLCFLPGNVMDSIKSWFLTNKVAALQSQVPKVPKENDTAPSHK